MCVVLVVVVFGGWFLHERRLADMSLDELHELCSSLFDRKTEEELAEEMGERIEMVHPKKRDSKTTGKTY
jgi:hypothetical protein